MNFLYLAGMAFCGVIYLHYQMLKEHNKQIKEYQRKIARLESAYDVIDEVNIDLEAQNENLKDALKKSNDCWQQIRQ